MQTRQRKSGAFTLIELMIVILILGILAALIVPRLFANQGKAEKGKAVADISELSNALGRFHVDNDRFPTDQEGLGGLMTAPADLPHWGPDKYIEKLPQDPWGDDYQYKDLGNNQFEVRSLGPDKTPNTDDDITNNDTTAPQ